MKLNYFKYAMAFLSLGVLATSCTSEDIMPDTEKPVEKDSKFYINVSIATPAEQTTRANDNSSVEDFENGTYDEQKINEILFVFYNTSNKFVGSTTINMNDDGSFSTPEGDPIEGSGTPGNGTGSVETILDVIVPVSVSSGSLKPAYVIAYVNPTVNPNDDNYGDTQRSFEQALGLTRTLEQVCPSENSAGFTMSNSVYYDTTDGDWSRPKIAVEIPDDALYRTQQAAATSNDDTKRIIIYVERAVAKVTLNIDNTNFLQKDNKITDIKGNEYTLNFKILGWGLSMLEQQTFLIKNFRAREWGNVHNFDEVFTFSNMNETDIRKMLDAPLSNPSWNMPPTTLTNGISGHRSFWAFSPHYYADGQNRFPAYSDQINDGTVTPCLIYRNFNEIYDTERLAIGTYGKEVGKTQYTLEHTMETSVVNNQQKRGVTCALVVGQYSLQKADGSSSVQTFYIRNGVTSDGQDVNVIYPDDATLIGHVLSINNKIYVKNPEGSITEYSPIATSIPGLFEVKHPSKDISDGKYSPERFVAVQLVESEIGKGAYYLRDANGSYNLISAENGNIEAANQALFGLMGGVEKYHSGYANFVVPVEHLWGRADTDSKIGDDGFTATLGQYGIVRNHLYTINVKGIEGIGTGIGDPENPIVPNVEQEKYYVKTEMRVQRWRVVPGQDVTLKP